VVAWSKGAVRTILTNLRYTGHEVWNKQRKTERLINVEDVALGHETKMTWNPKEAWVFSNSPTHPALVSKDDFELVQQRLHSRGPTSTGRVLRTKHPYALKGMFTHATCRRRMQGNWNSGLAYYRCRFPSEYALANNIDHPLTVYIREDAVLPSLDHWLSQAFGQDRIEHALTTLEEAQPEADPRIEAVRRTITDCDCKLARHRAALEAGTDAKLVATWSCDVQAQRTTAELQLAQLTGQHQDTGRMSREEIRAVIDTLGGMLTVIRNADPADKHEVYRALGVHLTYDDKTRKVLVESRPAPNMCVLKVGRSRVLIDLQIAIEQIGDFPRLG
jgi:site-specific DNA recombinase